MENKISEIKSVERKAEELVRIAFGKKEKEIRDKQLEIQETVRLSEKEQREKAEEIFKIKVEQIVKEIELMERERNKEINRLNQVGKKNITRAVDSIIDYVLNKLKS